MLVVPKPKPYATISGRASEAVGSHRISTIPCNEDHDGNVQFALRDYIVEPPAAGIPSWTHNLESTTAWYVKIFCFVEASPTMFGSLVITLTPQWQSNTTAKQHDLSIRTPTEAVVLSEREYLGKLLRVYHAGIVDLWDLVLTGWVTHHINVPIVVNYQHRSKVILHLPGVHGCPGFYRLLGPEETDEDLGRGVRTNTDSSQMLNAMVRFGEEHMLLAVKQHRIAVHAQQQLNAAGSSVPSTSRADKGKGKAVDHF